MATIKAVIRRNKINQKGECVVFLRYGHRQKTVDFSSGLRVLSKYWNEKKEIVNESVSIGINKANNDLLTQTKRNDLLTNTKIKEEKAKIMGIVRGLELEGVEPEVSIIKEAYRKNTDNIEKNLREESLQSLWTDFISVTSKSVGTKEKYKNAQYHLSEFEKSCGIKLRVKDVNLKFYDHFMNFLYNEIKKPDETIGLSDNTVGTTIKNLKVFLNYLGKRGFPIPDIIEEFKAPKIINPVIFLTENEIYQLRIHEFKSEKLIKVRDVFVLNCYLGLRYSDLVRLSKSHIEDGVIKLRAYKNQKDISVPLTTIPLEILIKYDYQLPIISEQKFNEYIKEACKEANISSEVEMVITKSGNKTYSMVPKHDLITSHIAIKTFITLCGKKGISPKQVSEITGKSVEVILKHYYGLDLTSLKSDMLNAFG